LVLAAVLVWWNYSRLVNLLIPSQHRPGAIVFTTERVSDQRFEQIAQQLVERYGPAVSANATSGRTRVYAAVAKQRGSDLRSREVSAGLDHIDRFRKAGIREYRGPETCLACHRTMRIVDGRGGYTTVDTRQNVEASIHFRLNQFSGFNTYGFDGQRVDGIPLGKIDRACGIPGTFTWTGWATLVKTKNGEMRSDGCGQCHEGGQYGPFTGTMFHGYSPVSREFASVDCLVCHSRTYDMDQKYVVQDPDGRYRWNQDRGLAAAMAVGRPTSDNCLRCHEHDMGGDAWRDNLAAQHPGYRNPRLLHRGAKRGTPIRGADVHYLAGVQCLDCHASQGHLIARGTHTTDLVSNDLPGTTVDCEQCHGATPHPDSTAMGPFLNGHTDRVACETCHITHLTDDNVVLRDWTEPVFNADEGIWTPKDVLRSGAPGEAIVYRWHNGSGTFMAGALGDHPDGQKRYRAFTTTPDSAFSGFDYLGYYERVFRPLAASGHSKIAPFKRFNAKMYEDLDNQGPFGGMILPVDYNTYYETGDPRDAVRKAMEDPIIQLMYGTVFKHYLMDDFMHYMGIAQGWSIPFKGQFAGRWMRQDATLMINHSITRDAFRCRSCHTAKARGILPFEDLGYSPDQVTALRSLDWQALVGRR
jgi:hypothetical protein